MNFYRVDGVVCASFLQLDLPPAEKNESEKVSVFLFKRSLLHSRASFAVNDETLLYQEQEDARWLSSAELTAQAMALGEAEECVRAAVRAGRLRAVNCAHPRWRELLQNEAKAAKKRVHLLALGDVGSHILIGLRLLGADVLERVGIYDLNENLTARWELEANQIVPAFASENLPEVEIITKEQLFDCDAFIFAASAGVPAVGAESGDVRMAQLAKNTAIIGEYAKLAREAEFRGLFCVVSDPVDPLAKAAWLASNSDSRGNFDGLGLRAEQLQGYGLGVMNARAVYYAKREERFAHFCREGRCFGGHGKELVVADSIEHYHDALSRELTSLALEANLRMREIGFKPFVAPAYSSGVLSILATLRGQWHYGSVFLGGGYMGVRNRYTASGQEHEILPLPTELMERILAAEAALAAIN